MGEERTSTTRTGSATDAEVIRRSREDPEEFRTIVNRHAPRIYAYLANRAGTQDAADLGAEVFARAFGSRHRYRDEYESALPWLYGIATNVLRTHLRAARRAKRGRRRLAAAPPPDPYARADRRLDAAASRTELLRALAELRPEERDVLLLFAWEELSYPEIAQALGIPEGTVRSRLHRARTKLRDRLGGKGVSR